MKLNNIVFVLLSASLGLLMTALVMSLGVEPVTPRTFPFVASLFVVGWLPFVMGVWQLIDDYRKGNK